MFSKTHTAMSDEDLSQAPTQESQHAELLLDELPDDLTLTENKRPCLKSSGSATLNLFFLAVPGIGLPALTDLLSEAWAEDPPNTLRLIFQLGNCRKGQAGKLDRVNFVRALLWLWNKDPETLLLNLQEIVEQGCYKTLLDFLQAVLHEGSLEANLVAAARHKAHREAIREKALKKTRNREKEARQAALKRAFAAAEGVELGELYHPAALSLLGVEMGLPVPEKAAAANAWRKNCGKWASPEIASRFHAFIRAREEGSRAAAKEQRLARESAVADRVANMTADEKRLHDAVAAIFAEGIVKDREQLLASGHSVSGLAAKWAPTCNYMHDKNTLIVDAIIAKLPESVSTRGSTPRIRYQQACAEVRRAAKVPESFIGRGEWGLVDYKRMPSLCRKLYGEKLFKKHDEARYVAFLAEAKEAARAGKKALVHTGALLPHMVTSTAREDSVEADLQWHGLVTRLIQARASGGAGMMIPVCDVSGSMSGKFCSRFACKFCANNTRVECRRAHGGCHRAVAAPRRVSPEGQRRLWQDVHVPRAARAPHGARRPQSRCGGSARRGAGQARGVGQGDALGGQHQLRCSVRPPAAALHRALRAGRMRRGHDRVCV